MKASVGVEYPSERKNRKHLRGEESVCKRHTELTAAHPIIVILCVGSRLVRQLVVRLFALVVRLYYLNAVYVFNHRAAHFGSSFDRALVILRVVSHDRHHKHKGYGEHRK